MAETIQLGAIAIALTRKDVKHVHLSVHPPSGRVTLVAPTGTRSEVARAYVLSKLGWVRDQQAKMRGQARETTRQFVERESHYLWGRRYLLTVRKEEAKPSVRLGHRAITLTVRPGSSYAANARRSCTNGTSLFCIRAVPGTDCHGGSRSWMSTWPATSSSG